MTTRGLVLTAILASCCMASDFVVTKSTWMPGWTLLATAPLSANVGFVNSSCVTSTVSLNVLADCLQRAQGATAATFSNLSCTVYSSCSSWQVRGALSNFVSSAGDVNPSRIAALSGLDSQLWTSLWASTSQVVATSDLCVPSIVVNNVRTYLQSSFCRNGGVASWSSPTCVCRCNAGFTGSRCARPTALNTINGTTLVTFTVKPNAQLSLPALKVLNSSAVSVALVRPLTASALSSATFSSLLGASMSILATATVASASDRAVLTMTFVDDTSASDRAVLTMTFVDDMPQSVLELAADAISSNLTAIAFALYTEVATQTLTKVFASSTAMLANLSVSIEMQSTSAASLWNGFSSLPIVNASLSALVVAQPSLQWQNALVAGSPVALAVLVLAGIVIAVAILLWTRHAKPASILNGLSTYLTFAGILTVASLAIAAATVSTNPTRLSNSTYTAVLAFHSTASAAQWCTGATGSGITTSPVALGKLVADGRCQKVSVQPSVMSAPNVLWLAALCGTNGSGTSVVQILAAGVTEDQCLSTSAGANTSTAATVPCVESAVWSLINTLLSNGRVSQLSVRCSDKPSTDALWSQWSSAALLPTLARASGTSQSTLTMPTTVSSRTRLSLDETAVTSDEILLGTRGTSNNFVALSTTSTNLTAGLGGAATSPLVIDGTSVGAANVLPISAIGAPGTIASPPRPWRHGITAAGNGTVMTSSSGGVVSFRGIVGTVADISNPTSSDLSSSDGSFTISMWCQLPSAQSRGVLFAVVDDATVDVATRNEFSLGLDHVAVESLRRADETLSASSNDDDGIVVDGESDFAAVSLLVIADASTRRLLVLTRSASGPLRRFTFSSSTSSAKNLFDTQWHFLVVSVQQSSGRPTFSVAVDVTESTGLAASRSNMVCGNLGTIPKLQAAGAFWRNSTTGTTVMRVEGGGLVLTGASLSLGGGIATYGVQLQRGQLTWQRAAGLSGYLNTSGSNVLRSADYDSTASLVIAVICIVVLAAGFVISIARCVQMRRLDAQCTPVPERLADNPFRLRSVGFRRATAGVLICLYVAQRMNFYLSTWMWPEDYTWTFGRLWFVFSLDLIVPFPVVPGWISLTIQLAVLAVGVILAYLLLEQDTEHLYHRRLKPLAEARARQQSQLATTALRGDEDDNTMPVDEAIALQERCHAAFRLHGIGLLGVPLLWSPTEPFTDSEATHTPAQDSPLPAASRVPRVNSAIALHVKLHNHPGSDIVGNFSRQLLHSQMRHVARQWEFDHGAFSKAVPVFSALVPSTTQRVPAYRMDIDRFLDEVALCQDVDHYIINAIKKTEGRRRREREAKAEQERRDQARRAALMRKASIRALRDPAFLVEGSTDPTNTQASTKQTPNDGHVDAGVMEPFEIEPGQIESAALPVPEKHDEEMPTSEASRSRWSHRRVAVWIPGHAQHRRDVDHLAHLQRKRKAHLAKSRDQQPQSESRDQTPRETMSALTASVQNSPRTQRTMQISVPDPNLEYDFDENVDKANTKDATSAAPPQPSQTRSTAVPALNMSALGNNSTTQPRASEPAASYRLEEEAVAEPITESLAHFNLRPQESLALQAAYDEYHQEFGQGLLSNLLTSIQDEQGDFDPIVDIDTLAREHVATVKLTFELEPCQNLLAKAAQLLDLHFGPIEQVAYEFARKRELQSTLLGDVAAVAHEFHLVVEFLEAQRTRLACLGHVLTGLTATLDHHASHRSERIFEQRLAAVAELPENYEFNVKDLLLRLHSACQGFLPIGCGVTPLLSELGFSSDPYDGRFKPLSDLIDTIAQVKQLAVAKHLQSITHSVDPRWGRIVRQAGTAPVVHFTADLRHLAETVFPVIQESTGVRLSATDETHLNLLLAVLTSESDDVRRGAATLMTVLTNVRVIVDPEKALPFKEWLTKARSFKDGTPVETDLHYRRIVMSLSSPDATSLTWQIRPRMTGLLAPFDAACVTASMASVALAHVSSCAEQAFRTLTLINESTRHGRTSSGAEDVSGDIVTNVFEDCQLLWTRVGASADEAIDTGTALVPLLQIAEESVQPNFNGGLTESIASRCEAQRAWLEALHVDRLRFSQVARDRDLRRLAEDLKAHVPSGTHIDAVIAFNETVEDVLRRKLAQSVPPSAVAMMTSVTQPSSPLDTARSVARDTNIEPSAMAWWHELVCDPAREVAPFGFMTVPSSDRMAQVQVTVCGHRCTDHGLVLVKDDVTHRKHHPDSMTLCSVTGDDLFRGYIAQVGTHINGSGRWIGDLARQNPARVRCPASGCSYSVCEAAAPRDVVQRLQSRASDAILFLSDKSVLSATGVLAFLLVGVILLPSMKSVLAVLSCHTLTACDYPRTPCYGVGMDPSFLLAAFLCMVVAVAGGAAVYPGVVRILHLRKTLIVERVFVEEDFDSPGFGFLGRSEQFRTPASVADFTTTTAPVEAWHGTVLAVDDSMLRAVYSPFRCRFASVGFAYVFIAHVLCVTLALFVSNPDGILQLAALCGLEGGIMILTCLTMPFNDMPSNLLAVAATSHQVGIIAISAFARMTRYDTDPFSTHTEPATLWVGGQSQLRKNLSSFGASTALLTLSALFVVVAVAFLVAAVLPPYWKARKKVLTTPQEERVAAAGSDGRGDSNITSAPPVSLDEVAHRITAAWNHGVETGTPLLSQSRRNMQAASVSPINVDPSDLVGRLGDH